MTGGGDEPRGVDPPPDLVEPPAPPSVRAPFAAPEPGPRAPEPEPRDPEPDAPDAPGAPDASATDTDADGDEGGRAELPATQPSTAPMTAPGAAVRPLFDIDSWMDAPPGTIPGLADAAAEDDLDRTFAPEAFREYDDVLPGGPWAEAAPAPTLAGVSPYGMPPDDAPVAPPAPTARRLRALLAVGGVVVAALALVAVFAAGRGMAGLATGQVTSPTAPPSARSAPTAAPTVPLALAAAGTQPWDRLAGGECIQGFTSSWAQTFTVVGCDKSHTAQLLLRAPFSDARNAAYPGITALEQRMSALCSAPGVVDLAKAAAASDLQLNYAFPATRAQWEDGDRDYWCFATRSSGAPISGSITAGAQEAVWAARAAPAATSAPSPTPKKK